MKAIQRVKQFYWSIFDKMNKEDILYVNKLLNNEEKELFFKLSNNEQKHSVRVANLMEEKLKGSSENSFDRDYMVRIALLHDIGKITARINPIEKSILVLLNLFTKGNLKKYSKFNKVKVFYSHGELGYTILKKIGYDNKFLDIIKNHHNLSYMNSEVILLRECDDKN